MAEYKSAYTGSQIDQGITKANEAYVKPNDGIPKTDLSSEVQASLGKADTAIQDVSDKQDTLVSGTNIKTINNQSILGSGNITIGSGGSLSEEFKEALLDCFENVAWDTSQGQTYYDALYEALYGSKTLVSISAVFTQGANVIYDDASLDSLKQYLVVTALYDDSSTETVTNYILSGTLTAGTSTITVTYSGKTTTFNVIVTARPELSSIEATYTQGQTVVTPSTELNSLKSGLVVIATYTDQSTRQLANSEYTLSGTLTEGTSTITVTFEGKTDTFNVNVTVPSIQMSTIADSAIYTFNDTTSTLTLEKAPAYESRWFGISIEGANRLKVTTENNWFVGFHYADGHSETFSANSNGPMEKYSWTSSLAPSAVTIPTAFANQDTLTFDFEYANGVFNLKINDTQYLSNVAATGITILRGNTPTDSVTFTELY